MTCISHGPTFRSSSLGLHTLGQQCTANRLFLPASRFAIWVAGVVLDTTSPQTHNTLVYYLLNHQSLGAKSLEPFVYRAIANTLTETHETQALPCTQAPEALPKPGQLRHMASCRVWQSVQMRHSELFEPVGHSWTVVNGRIRKALLPEKKNTPGAQ